MAGHGKVVIVTGAASGIGAACVRLLLQQGYRVCCVDRDTISAGELQSVHAGDIIFLRADVSNTDDCRAAVNAAIKTFGRLDGLIHMAAIHSTKTWRELDADEFNRTLAVNVTGSFLMAQAAALEMEKTGGGSIVLASSGSISVSGVGGHGRGGAAYVSSKAAVIGLTRALARSLAPSRIRVNAVSPGATQTAMTAEYDEVALAKVAERTLTGSIGKPEEIAAAAIFLLSDAASYIDGEILAVNGGGSFGL
jgi:NAD(P)-dependent dehydrogenase (short-subunit alcohol dehydrogenase family)